jgi:orotate phosphoribosyltransferase
VNDFRQEFLAFALAQGVLRFGEFTTKAGRKSPYFFNAGLFNDGESLRRLGRYYAEAVLASGVVFDQLFGPAYKGITLVAATGIALAEKGHNLPFSFNRKEAKDHGEGGNLVGWELRAGHRVLIVEDVTTAGTSIRETVPLLKAAAEVTLAGLVVAVDRMERGTGDQSALSEVGEAFRMKTFSIVTIAEIVEHLSSHDVDGRRIITDEIRERIALYRKEYGPR